MSELVLAHLRGDGPDETPAESDAPPPATEEEFPAPRAAEPSRTAKTKKLSKTATITDPAGGDADILADMFPGAR